MAEIIEQIGDESFPVGLTIRMGIMGTTPVQLGTNVMAAIGEAAQGPAMEVLPLTSSYEVAQYYRDGPLARAGRVAFAQGLPAGYFIRVLGEGFTHAKKYVHDGLTVEAQESFYGDGTEGPYNLEFKTYKIDEKNAVSIGDNDFDVVYSEEGLESGKVYLDIENGTLTFYENEGPLSTDLVTCNLVRYRNLGVFASPNDGAIGNSAYVDVSDGTFDAMSKQIFTGDGSAGPYYLEFHNIVEDNDNKLTVNGTKYTLVYSAQDLGTKKAYLNKDEGSVTFFTGEGPTQDDVIEIQYNYKSKCIVVGNGETTEPAIDNLNDLVAIQAALMYNSNVTFTPDALATHLPANGRYRLTGGTDGAAIQASDYARAHDALMEYMENTMTNVTTVVYTDNEIQPGTYDLIPVIAGKANEMKRNFYPAIHFIGMKPNENPDVAGKIVRNFSNYELVVVMNPWDTSQPERLDATVARAAQEATAPLGTSCARRVANMAIQGLSPYGLLNTYRRETVKALHNNRLDVLIKSVGIYSFYGRTTAQNTEYMECVDIRTMNYVIWCIKYITDGIYFAKNTPSVRATLKSDIQHVLDRLVDDEIMDRYTLAVESGRKYGNKGLVLVKLEAENVGHIKRVRVDYYNGIIESGGTIY